MITTIVFKLHVLTRTSSLTKPLLLHLAAVAFYRTGDEKIAWKLWREILQQAPGFDLARESLPDK